MKWNITLSKQSCRSILQWNKLVDDLLLCIQWLTAVYFVSTQYSLFCRTLRHFRRKCICNAKLSCHRAVNYTVIQVHFISFHFYLCLKRDASILHFTSQLDVDDVDAVRMNLWSIRATQKLLSSSIPSNCCASEHSSERTNRHE